MAENSQSPEEFNTRKSSSTDDENLVTRLDSDTLPSAQENAENTSKDFENLRKIEPGKSKLSNLFSNTIGNKIGNKIGNTLFESNSNSQTSESWSVEGQKQIKKSAKWKQILGYFSFGVATFLVFLYLTFPYGVIKEVIVNKANSELQAMNMPIRLSLGELKLHWLNGITLKKLNVTNSADVNTKLELDELTVSVKIFPLIIGRIVAAVDAKQGKGTLDAKVGLKIADVLKNNPSPASAEAVFQKFTLTPIFSHAIAYFKGSKDPGLVLLLPLLAKTTAGGDLSGKIDFENSDTTSMNSAKGFVDLKLNDGFLHINDNTLKIPKQTFSDARIDVKFEGANINLGSTNFKAEDIGIGLGGKITLADANTGAATADMSLDLMMAGEVEKNLGFILPNLMRCKPLTNGELKAKLSGPLALMNCQ